MVNRSVPYRDRNYERQGWTQQSVRRSRQQWPYAHLLSDQHGNLIIETVHGGESSLRIEVQTSAKRIRDGTPNRGGQIATTIDVDGLDRAAWQAWAT